jgi:hypothetical protein
MCAVASVSAGSSASAAAARSGVAVMASCSTSVSIVAAPSSPLARTLPVKPSVTTTSARPPYGTSRPSTLPTKRIGSADSASYAALRSSSPLPGSSPMDSSPTRGSARPEPHGREGRAGQRELGQQTRGGLRGRPDVEEDERPRLRRHHSGEWRTGHAAQPAEGEDRGGQRSAGRADRHQGVRVAVAHEPRGDPHGRVALGPHGPRRVLVHLHDLAGRHQSEPPVHPALVQQPLGQLDGAHQHQLDAGRGVLGVQDRAVHDGLGGVVTAEQVERDPRHVSSDRRSVRQRRRCACRTGRTRCTRCAAA